MEWNNMPITFHKAVRTNTPIIIGLSGPSKSGKTYSALRLATGMANGGQIAMINTEGPRGHSYAEKFNYITADLEEPFSMKKYEEAIKAAAELNPSVLIIDSVSHAHEGSGGMLDQHETELDRMAGNDFKKRDRMTWAAWIKPKADEANMINTMLRVGCSIILCFRAKEKLKIVKGKDPVDLGWQPIGSERIHFETAFTLTLPPFSVGKPDMAASMMREPFDTMIKGDVQLNEDLGKKIAEWAKGGVASQSNSNGHISEADWKSILKELHDHEINPISLCTHFKVSKGSELLASQVSEVKKWISDEVDRKNAA
jgi:AAA domain